MEPVVSEYEPMIREFLEVESLVIAGYAQEYACEVYGSLEGSDEREIARRDFYVCMFGLVERCGLVSLADRTEFLNRKATEISFAAAREVGVGIASPVSDTSATWYKRMRDLFGTIHMKGHIKKDEDSFSVFVSMHEDRNKYHHDLTKKVA